MALNVQSPHKHNEMLGRQVPHPKSTNYDESDRSPAKRLFKRPRLSEADDSNSECTEALTPQDGRSDAEGDGDTGVIANAIGRTDLDSALPPIKTDEEAIEEYEAFKASQASRDGGDTQSTEAKWVRGKSSIYVDAFKLALDTVLEEERHLFNEPEQAVFKLWQELNYEAQYLYIRLFLRKTFAWHRIEKLGYHSDIADMNAAVRSLQTARDLPSASEEVEMSSSRLQPPEGTTLDKVFTFADQSEVEITSFTEASSLLLLDEVKSLAKDAKVTGKNKQEFLTGLRRLSRRQTTLKRSDTTESSASATSFHASEERSNSLGGEDSPFMSGAHLFQKTMAMLGPCIRLSLAPLKLFERVLLVFYRSTDWTENSLTRIILAKIDRRSYPPYLVSRSTNVFASRALLVEFEASLRIQFEIDNILEFSGRPTEAKLQEIVDMSEEVYPRWITLLAEEQEKENSIYQSGEGAYLRRLSPAWVYTRVIHKANYVHGKRKDHEKEYQTLIELLSQRLFHTARRGAWYQRKALLEEHYMADLRPREKRDVETQKKHWKRTALQTCVDGMQDSLVHVIYHHDLQKRIMKLEKSLKVAKRAQHDFGHVRLAKAVEVTVEGTRVRGKIQATNRGRRSSSESIRKSTKTIWLDPLEDNNECGVEAMCLSSYRSRGYKGYHSEGGIVRTLFAYLFCDILFLYIPNVFQTPYQTCPLDLHTDAFYPARLSEINHRLAEISNGAAKSLIKTVWDEHSEKKTCVVGLNWDFEIDDLLEIARCFDGNALATICKVMAQEYGQRGGGVPDLFCWHVEKGEVLFAEVKSENDRLSDTQRLWIDVLTGAGVRVELCHAVSKDEIVVE